MSGSAVPNGARAGRLHRALRRGRGHSDGHYVARSVYGAVLVLALLITLQDHPPGAFRDALLVTVTVFSVLAAEAYADLLGMEIDLRRPTSPQEQRAKLADLGVVMAAAEVPVVVFVLSGLGLYSESTAFIVAEWLTIAWLFLSGFLARRLSGQPVLASLRSALVIGGVGVLLAVLKQIAHG